MITGWRCRPSCNRRRCGCSKAPEENWRPSAGRGVGERTPSRASSSPHQMGCSHRHGGPVTDDTREPRDPVVAGPRRRSGCGDAAAAPSSRAAHVRAVGHRGLPPMLIDGAHGW
jgi:hypothetical protein